ncbi:DUF3606 domain-containing protein [Pedobacter sp. GR22-6]|uniref:DUF3606 domain-containing protein n=1 Tax=Pedobacter sp. GR22-6 TaxID=3127957 RepID=UPI003FCD17B5
MEGQNNQQFDPELILDCAQQHEICYWASKFRVSPMALKTAVRACCSNRILHIARYLQDHRRPGQSAAGVL